MSNLIQKDMGRKAAYEKDGIQNPTGNVFLDKPWVTHYLSVPHKVIPLEQTLYTNYVTLNADNLSNDAVYTSDNSTYTHGQLLALTDNFAAGLAKMGIKDGDRIGIMVNGTIEEPVILLAASKIGAVTKWIDFSKSVPDILRTIAPANLKLLIVDEMLLPLVAFVNMQKLPVIVVATDKAYDSDGNIDFAQVVSMGKDITVETVDYVANKPAIIINSSGTTGHPKPIVHSDYSVNAAAQKMMYVDFPLTRENVMLKTIPAHLSLGLVTTLYSSLLSGTKVVLIRGRSPEESIKNTIIFFEQYKKFVAQKNLDPNAKAILFSAPMFYRTIVEGMSKIKDLSYIGALLAGGSKMSADELDTMQNIYETGYCTVPICNGYGQNEQCGATAINANSYDLPGSCGIPLIGTDIRIVDSDTMELLNADQPGKILVRSDSEFLYYENMDEETAKARVTLADGTTWFDTKDIGYMAEDGHLFILGRENRVIVRFDCKFSAEIIEDKIRSHSAVKDCAVVALKENGVDNDQVVVCLILEDGSKDYPTEQIIADLRESKEPLADLEIPAYIEIVDQFPSLSSGKIDYKELEKAAEKKYENRQR